MLIIAATIIAAQPTWGRTQAASIPQLVLTQGVSAKSAMASRKEIAVLRNAVFPEVSEGQPVLFRAKTYSAES